MQHNPQNPKYNQPSTLTGPLLFFFLLFRFFFFFFSLIIHTLFFFLFFFISLFFYIYHILSCTFSPHSLSLLAFLAFSLSVLILPFFYIQYVPLYLEYCPSSLSLPSLSQPAHHSSRFKSRRLTVVRIALQILLPVDLPDSNILLAFAFRSC